MSDRELFELWLGDESEISDLRIKKKANVHSLSSFYVQTILVERLKGFSPEMIKYNEHGKPYLTDVPYSYNLSHCGDTYALLLCRSEFCGIDIQTVKSAGKFENALRSVLTDREYDLLEGKGGDRDFFQLWSVKEAFVKALGGSIWYGRDYDFQTVPGDYSDRWFRSNDLYLYSTEISPDIFLSMASPVKPKEIDFRNFSLKYFS